MAKLDMSPEEIARRLARDTKWVQLHLAIGVQPDPVKKALREKRMTVNTIAESMAVKEQHREMAEQTLLRLAERSSPIDDAYAHAEMRREIERAEKAAAWEAGKTPRMEALKDMLTARKWKLKLLHRRYDEPLDSNCDWSGIGDDLVTELECYGVDGDTIPAKYREKKIGDLVNAYGGVSGLVVPKQGWHRDDAEYCADDAVVRVNLTKLVEMNDALPEKDRWFESPKHIEPDVDPEPVDWKERNRIEKEKRENRKSVLDTVRTGMGLALQTADKRILVEKFRTTYRDEMLADAKARLSNHALEFFPMAANHDEAAKLLEEWMSVPIIRQDISLLEALGRMFDDLDALQWIDTRAGKLLDVFESFPACPELDRAIAAVQQIQAGEL
jgi:hypothetical protein